VRAPKPIPQTLGEAIQDFIAALDVSIDRIAPFAALHPEQLRRLGKDAKHRTLTPDALDRLIEATELIGSQLPAWQRDVWTTHLKTASFYTVLVIAAHRRTKMAWPKTPNDYQHVWDKAKDLVIHSGGILYHARDEGVSYQERSKAGFLADAFGLYWKWSRNELEGVEAVRAALEQFDKALRDSE